GTNDAPLIGGDSAGAVTEDVDPDADLLLETAGALTIADPDAGESSFVAGTIVGTYGDLVIDTLGNWTYSANTVQAAIQGLDVTESITDTLTVTTFDGTTHDVVITINGAEDAPVQGGINSGTVAEDGTLVASNTLTISDADTSDNPVSYNNVATTAGDNGYGTFAMSGNTWTYTLNNANTDVQALDVTESLTDTYTITATDGSMRTVTITINGAEDAPLQGGDILGTVAEDGTLVDGGTLSITDVDNNDNPVSYNNVATTAGNNGYGTFAMSGNTWTYTLNNAHTAVQALDVTESLTDTYTFIATDGSTQLVTVTIDGAEDAPTLDNAMADQTATEDSPFTFTFNANTFADVDTSDTLAYTATLSGGGALPGWLSFDPLTRTFSGTPLNADVGSVAIDVIADDGTSNITDTFTITVNNTNDAPLIGGISTGSVTEDIDPDADTLLEVNNALTITDPDVGESSFVAGTIVGTYGDLVIDTAGNWSYSADNTQSAIQSLDVTEWVTDTLTVTTADGSTHNIVITINGAEDAPLQGGGIIGTVAEDGTLIASDTLTITDADTSDNPVSYNNQATIAGDNGYGTFALAGNTWTYTLNNALPAVQALDAGESATDTFTFTASDGSTQIVTVTINGAEDAPVQGGTNSGITVEDGGAIGNVLTISDVDASDNPVSYNNVAAVAGDNGYGTFAMAGNSWTYTLNNTLAAIQSLDTGDTLSDSTTFTASDGSTQLVTVTINGAEDAPTA
ncbi:MAG: VCBS domain-containing protein, partial [Pseudomonadales bacterium]